MRKSPWLLLKFLAFLHFLVTNTEAVVEERAEARVPVSTLSPPEGNTTFLDDTSWCVAQPSTSPIDLQIALDWACGIGRVECGPIQPGGPCFEPNDLHSHASFAFNSYYQQNGNNHIACYFGGTAVLTQTNPSYARCEFATSESMKSSSSSLSRFIEMKVLRSIDVVFVLLYLGF